MSFEVIDAAQDGSLAERLQFEELISDLCAEFINLPVDRIEQMIEDGTEKGLRCPGVASQRLS